MATANTITPKSIYAPKGCDQLVMAYFTETECADLERIQQLEMRSKSATARMLMLHDIEQYDQDTLKAE